MDIRGFGDANVRKFYEMGLLKDIPGVYTLDFSKISGLEGFGQKSIDNLQSAISNSKNQPLNRLIYALGIRFVGETTAKTLAQAVNHLLDFKNFSIEQLQSLEDVGPKVGGSIHHFFSNQENIHMLEELERLGLQLKTKRKNWPLAATCKGSLSFYRHIAHIKRSDAEAMVETNEANC